MTVDGGILRLNVEHNSSQKWTDLMGDYKCIADNSYSLDFKTMQLTVENVIIPGKLSFIIFYLGEH